MAGDIFRTLTGHPVPHSVEEMTKIVERMIGKPVHIAPVFPDVTASQSGIYPLDDRDPERAMQKIFPRIKKKNTVIKK
ncbi:MAG: hypothetical protein HGA67_00970 [Candidatus Yonathbacteria bacterium]|nr:hypothetical protein [Candidatus Yonathbacteria bacterium]